AKRLQNSDYFKDKMLLMQARENGVVLDEEELLFLVREQPNTFDADVDNQLVRDLARNEDNIFQADECDAFDSDVDDEPTAQSIFMANLSSAGPTNLQASSSDASILSEVPDLENANVASNNDQVEHEIHSEVQQSTVIDSNNADMGNSNVIPYEQYLTTNDVSVVPSCASSAPNTAYVLIDNNVHTPNEPLVTELAIYKEQVAIYEQRAKFELTEREQRMDDQMRILIQDRNRMEEKLKQELHSVKLQLNHSIKSQTVIQENVNTLQQTFKQRESQLLNDFSNLRKLKDKLENKLHAQDQSIQTVYMMLKPKKLCEQYSKIAIGAQNPFYLRKAKVAQPTLYDGNEIINPDHDPTNFPSSEEDLELAELARQKMHEKMNDPVCVEKRIKCIPPNYSKENFLATFTPQTQLTPEQVFWSIDLEKRKAEELKANTPPLPVLPPATVYPPNTPVHLAPQTLPTTSQVNIGLYVITQLFWDFEKTCKKRITPTGITEGERGFEQTKRCYLTFSDMYDALTIAQKRIADLKESVETLREIVEDAKVERPLDTSLASAFRYTKHSQELLEYVIGTCPKDFSPHDKQNASTTSLRKKRVTFVEPCNNIPKHVKQQSVQPTNVPILPSTGVYNWPLQLSGSKPKSNIKKDKTLPAKSVPKKKVEDQPRNNKSNPRAKKNQC
ncbi:hypothetical protein Tco_1089769, partial [Tanacetum coccineum]